MHDCGKASDTIVALAFDELLDDQRAEAVKKLAFCSSCHQLYEEAEKALSFFERAAESSIPTGEFWQSYDAKLRARLAAEPAQPKRPTFSHFIRSASFARLCLAACSALLLLVLIVPWSGLISKRRPLDAASRANDAGDRDIISGEPQTAEVAAVKARVAGSSRKPTRLKRIEGSTTAAQTGSGQPFHREVALHVEKAEMLLRSFRNAQPPADGAGFELGFERRLAGTLANRNTLLRREAARNRDIIAEELLDSFEPILVEIAHLQDGATASHVSSIKERIRKEFIFTEMQLYLARNASGGL